MKLYVAVCDNLFDDTEVAVFDELGLATEYCWTFLKEHSTFYDKTRVVNEAGYLFYAFWDDKGGYAFVKEVTLNE